MRFLLALVFSLFLATNSWGWGFMSNQAVVAPAGGGTALLELDFEETGTPTGVTVVTGTPDFDSTSPTMSGTYSVSIFDSGLPDRWEATFTETAEVWVAFEVNMTDVTPTANHWYFYVKDDVDANQFYIQQQATGGTRAYAAGASVVGTVTSPAMVDATTHYFKARIKYVDGNGNDEIDFWTSSDGTWSTPAVSSVVETLTGLPSVLVLVGNSDHTINLDNIKIDDEDIPDY